MRKPVVAFVLLLFNLAVVARESRVYTVADAWRAHASHVTVSGSGTVAKLLRDDRKGARHRGFFWPSTAA